MKRLFILRHAKAEAHDPARDHERRLTKRGHDDAQKIGTFLAKNLPSPELVLCSDSARTRETWSEVAQSLQGQINVEESRAYYLAEVDQLLQAVSGIDNRYSRVMVVGHNPGCQELALALLRDPQSGLARRVRQKFPTAALAIIDLPIGDWGDVAPGIGDLDDLIVPADL